MPLWIIGCDSTLPSTRLQTNVNLPVPTAAFKLPSPDRLRAKDGDTKLTLTPLLLIRTAFDLRPDIKSSFHRFKSEEARYDFFYSSRDSLTPRMQITNDFSEDRIEETVSREREHAVEFSLEKQFFDTTKVNFGAGYRGTDSNDEIGTSPFVSANLRYPLQASREKLERASEDIFRQNELSDVQLAYIQLVRRRLQQTLFRFYQVVDLLRRVQLYENWVADLEALKQQMDSIQSRDLSSDQQRLHSELTRIRADLRNTGGRRDVETTRLKSDLGVPFYVNLDLKDDPFNPFAGKTHAELLSLSIKTDPEIASLRNSMTNAEVQLDLARRGTWDIAFLLDGAANLEGHGASDTQSDWHATVGFDVSAVDPRVTGSLSRQAQANIARFQQAISARENAIFADVFEPLTRIDTLGRSRTDLIANLPRFENDYAVALDQYLRGSFNIDDLLRRRRDLFDQHREISRLTFLVGANVSELCAATGKFFELIEDRKADGSPDEAARPATSGDEDS